MPQTEHRVPPGITRTLSIQTTPGAFCRVRLDDADKGAGADEAPHAVAGADGIARLYVNAQPGFNERAFAVACSPPQGDEEVQDVVLHEADENAPADEVLPAVEVERELSRDPEAWRGRADFDPFSAAPGDLEERGYPPRPDRDQLVQFASWSKLVWAMAGPPRVLEPMDVRSFPGWGRFRPHEPLHVVDVLDVTPTPVWCGVGYKEPAGTFTGALGIWHIPSVDSDVDGSCEMSHWVGLDGYNEPDVIQAGVTSTCVKAGFIQISTLYAWYEWFPDPPKALGLNVGPGEQIFARVAVSTDDKTADFFLINARGESERHQGVGRPASLPAAGGGNRDQAEWIVERPGGPTATPNVFRRDPLPIFASVRFSTMSAWDDTTNTGFMNDAPHRRFVMTNVPGTQMLAYPNIDDLASSTDTYVRQGTTEYV